jgi:hypothetical protein
VVGGGRVQNHSKVIDPDMRGEAMWNKEQALVVRDDDDGQL